jgi:hypothetical protein
MLGSCRDEVTKNWRKLRNASELTIFPSKFRDQKYLGSLICDTGKETRSVGQIMREMKKNYMSQGRQEYPIYNKKKEV